MTRLGCRCVAVAFAVACAAAAAYGQVPVVNSDFSQGNTAFASDFPYAVLNTADGQYTVTATPSSFNAGFVNPAGASAMLVVNGPSRPVVGRSRVWSQTIPVGSGYGYEVHCRAASAVAGQMTRLRWLSNGAYAGDEVLLPSAAGQWVDIGGGFGVFRGRNHTLLTLECLSDSGQPNDFYVDDITVSVSAVFDFCGNTDFDRDGDVGTDADIEAFFRCLAGSCCATCDPYGSDFNGDGDAGTDEDIEDFFRLLVTGDC